MFLCFYFLQTRKDVTITYSNPSSGSPIHFDDIVQYRPNSSSPSSNPSRIVGIDTLSIPASGNSASNTTSTRFKWRGKGWLMIASSRWQVLGCSLSLTSNPPTNSLDIPWALTYFEKTLFTPAGLDIYARTAEGLPQTLVDEIISKTKELGGDIGMLADSFFKVSASV